MSQSFICTNCGHIGDPKLEVKGNGLIEILLWLFIFPVGILYSIWRRSGRKNVCSKCKSDQIIPSDAPRAKKILGETGTSLESYFEDVEAKEIAKQEKIKKESKLMWIILTVVIVVVFSALFAAAT